jgi:dTDP-glucose 4,6-dehydratase
MADSVVPQAPRTVVVLGANSFSGQDLVDLLLDDPRYRVLGVSRSAERGEVFLKYLERPGRAYRFYQLDLNHQMKELLALLDAERPEYIVNFAAQSEVAPSWESPADWFQTNCVALAELINHLRRGNYVQRYLHISSPEVYGTCIGTVKEDAPLRPSTPYAASKAAADLLLQTYHRQFGFPLVTVRATNVYGARQQLFKIIPRTVISIRKGRPIPLHGGGRAVKSYIHIRDVSRGEQAILERGKVGELYHLSPDSGLAVRDVVATIAARMGRRLEEVIQVVEERPGQDAAYVIDSTRAREELNWRPEIAFEAGIEEVIAWVDRYWNQLRDLPLEYRHRP